MAKVVDEAKEKVEQVVETVKEEVTTKKGTWLNRVCSAVVGAVVAVGAMFGITQPKIDAQKAKAAQAIEQIKKGDVNGATKTLQEIAGQVKQDVETVKTAVKDADKGEVAKTAVDGAKAGVAKAEAKTETKTDAKTDAAKTTTTPATTETKK
jgi:hypothetical protein